MNIHLILLLCFFALAGIIAIFAAMIKCGFWRNLFWTLFSGTGVLLLLHFTSFMTGLSVPVNWYSLGVSAFGGIPAVVGMIVLKMLST